MRSILSLILALALASSLRAATQTITLKPGWNSVWLLVDPTNPDPATVFAGVPVDQVWCWFPTNQPVQFIDDQANGLLNAPGWSVYIPAGKTESFLTNLSTIQAHRPYLIKMPGSSNVTLTVTGTQSYKPIKWRADAFSLVGFDVDPLTGGGSVGSFFFNDSAHKNQSMFRLEPGLATWLPVATNTPIKYGEAYWIFTKGNSTFNGPVSVKVDTGTLDYGPATEIKTITLTNESAFTSSITLGNPSNLPLVIATGADPTTTWQPLTSSLFTLAAGDSTTLRLGARRTGLSAEVNGTLSVTAPSVSIPVGVHIGLADGAALAAGAAGLWVGSVVLDHVTDVNNSPVTPVGTKAPFTMRLMLHVNAAGSVNLLKQVIMMRKNGAAGEVTDAVLITDDTKLPDFKGALLRNGRPFGQRISAIGYDFEGNQLPLTGTFGSTLSGTINLTRALATNPFKHKYHPDHDDLDKQGDLTVPAPNPFPAGRTPDQQEVWDVSRAVTISFTAPPNDHAPSTGSTRRDGTYQEVITGLNRQTITLSGSFTLTRASTIAELNPAP